MTRIAPPLFRLVFGSVFPDPLAKSYRELCQLLVADDSEFVVFEQTLSLIAAETNQIDKFQGPTAWPRRRTAGILDAMTSFPTAQRGQNVLY